MKISLIFGREICTLCLHRKCIPRALRYTWYVCSSKQCLILPLCVTKVQTSSCDKGNVFWFLTSKSVCMMVEVKRNAWVHVWCFQTSYSVLNAQKLSSMYLCSRDSLGQLMWSHGPCLLLRTFSPNIVLHFLVIQSKLQLLETRKFSFSFSFPFWNPLTSNTVCMMVCTNIMVHMEYHSSLATWVENNLFQRCLNLWKINFVKCKKKNIQRVPIIIIMQVTFTKIQQSSIKILQQYLHAVSISLVV